MTCVNEVNRAVIERQWAIQVRYDVNSRQRKTIKSDKTYGFCKPAPKIEFH